MGYPEINHITLAGSNNRVRIKNNFPEALGLIHCPRWNRTLIYKLRFIIDEEGCKCQFIESVKEN